MSVVLLALPDLTKPTTLATGRIPVCHKCGPSMMEVDRCQ